MKLKSLYLVFILLILSNAVIAEKQIMIILDQPSLKMNIERTEFSPGDSCSLYLELDTFNLISEAEMDVYIEPKAIAKDVIYLISPGLYGEKLLYKEEIDSISERIIAKTIDFQVPSEVRSGSYEITARIITPTYKLSKSEEITISSGEEIISMMLLAALFILPAILIFRKDKKATKKTRRKRK